MKIYEEVNRKYLKAQLWVSHIKKDLENLGLISITKYYLRTC